MSKKIIYAFLAAFLLVSCAPEPFEGRITYEGEFESGLGDKLGILDNLIGQATNSEIDVYVKGGKVLVQTEAESPIFGSFRGAFTKMIFDLDNQRVYWVNDDQKTYAEEKLLETEIEGFSFKNMKTELDEAKKSLSNSTGSSMIQGYECAEYEIDGAVMDGKVKLSQQLINEMKATLSKIEGLHDYDFTGLGFPLYYESKVGGWAGMKYSAIRVDKKVLEDHLFSVDGYKKVDKIEYYKENFENMNLEAFGLNDEVDQLMNNLEGLGNDMKNKAMEGIGTLQDSIKANLNLGGVLDDLNKMLEGEDGK